MIGTIQKKGFMMSMLNRKKFMKHKKRETWNQKFLKKLWAHKEKRTSQLREGTNSIQNGRKINWSALESIESPVQNMKRKMKKKIESF